MIQITKKGSNLIINNILIIQEGFFFFPFMYSYSVNSQKTERAKSVLIWFLSSTCFPLKCHAFELFLEPRAFKICYCWKQFAVFVELYLIFIYRFSVFWKLNEALICIFRICFAICWRMKNLNISLIAFL